MLVRSLSLSLSLSVPRRVDNVYISFFSFCCEGICGKEKVEKVEDSKKKSEIKKIHNIHTIATRARARVVLRFKREKSVVRSLLLLLLLRSVPSFFKESRNIFRVCAFKMLNTVTINSRMRRCVSGYLTSLFFWKKESRAKNTHNKKCWTKSSRRKCTNTYSAWTGRGGCWRRIWITSSWSWRPRTGKITRLTVRGFNIRGDCLFFFYLFSFRDNKLDPTRA